MNKTVLEAKWKQVEGLIQKKWGKLTDDDLLAIKGDITLLGAKVQERYGLAKEEAQEQVEELLERFK